LQRWAQIDRGAAGRHAVGAVPMAGPGHGSHSGLGFRRRAATEETERWRFEWWAMKGLGLVEMPGKPKRNPKKQY